MSKRRLVSTTILLGLLVAACSEDGGDGSADTTSTTEAAAETTAPPVTDAPTTTAEPTTTTVDLATLAGTYAEVGPHPVGVTTLQLAKGPLVEVWYPAVEGSDGTDSYDVRDYVPPAIADLLTADVPAGYTYAATLPSPTVPTRSCCSATASPAFVCRARSSRRIWPAGE